MYQFLFTGDNFIVSFIIGLLFSSVAIFCTIQPKSESNLMSHCPFSSLCLDMGYLVGD